MGKAGSLPEVRAPGARMATYAAIRGRNAMNEPGYGALAGR